MTFNANATCRRVHILVCLLCAVVLTGCGTLPSLEGRTRSSALDISAARATALGQAIAPQADAHPGKSGIWPLPRARDAFAIRALLAQAAQRTLDVQYYIWHGDLTGTLLLEALHNAADRGVRVRLLLDDNGTSGLDAELMALESHPNIEVRLFNPFMTRSPKWLGYITDFSRANRRMHNKSFTADNQATIIGGRNIGDEYFGAAEGVLFEDLDVLAVGPVVNDVSTDFDRYWASESAYPVGLVLPAVSPAQIDALSAKAADVERDSKAQAYLGALREMTSIQTLLRGELDLEWTTTRMVSDDPAKGLKAIGKRGLLIYQLGDILGAPTRDVELVSPYFVPMAAGVDMFSELVARGVKVRVLTNALESSDVAAVHAGYAKRRKPLLEAGVILYETRRTMPEGKRNESAGPFGSSGSSLHAKTFSVDGSRVFIGSFNFDPRSANLNTELGFVIDSPTLARAIETAFDTTVPASAYQVLLDEAGKLYWIEQTGNGTVRYDTEPGVGFWKRAGVSFLSLLPIEWML